ncbi:unnamed protein product [Ambrosiozyma monospora]|uniref:Unnamed protein product n=1 Tax=Ambrosiozyma monospora TaxID=43982 RepID=A0ACB5UAM4_AMBMO|nr:unnamed protein product [Ambrosiozyma monospora]
MAFVDHVFSQLGDDVLPRVGNKTYGCVVYKNNNNASIEQVDAILPGDVVVILKAHFENHHSAGPFGVGGHVGKNKTTELGFGGKPYVAFVSSFDESKWKLKVIEFVEGKGVVQGTIRLGDLKSGKVRVFRIVGRDLFGW